MPGPDVTDDDLQDFDVVGEPEDRPDPDAVTGEEVYVDDDGNAVGTVAEAG